MNKTITESVAELSLYDLSLLFTFKAGYAYTMRELGELHNQLHSDEVRLDLRVAGIFIHNRPIGLGLKSLLRNGFVKSKPAKGEAQFILTVLGIDTLRL